MNMPSPSLELPGIPECPNLLWAKYTMAIEARDKLQDNFHKWMTYYYVAIAAIIVAITTISEKGAGGYTTYLFLGLIGMFISTLWHLSCKGYYYWSRSWVDIIIKYEKEINQMQSSIDFSVYYAFSKKVADEETSVMNPLSFANISTPKLTLLFSFFSILGWLGFSVFCFFHTNTTCNTGYIVLSSVFIFLYGCLFAGAIPNLVKSRGDDSHKLI